MNDYQAKFVAPEQAVKAVQSGDWVDYGFGAGFPELLDKALAARKGEVKDVKVRGGLVIRPRIEVVEADPEQESFSYYSWHVGDYERKLQKNGLVKFMPVMLRSLPYLYRDKHIRCDVAFVPVSKPDENGYCGLGISNYAWRTIFESARTVIFEINEHYPKLQGVDGSHRVHLSEADYIVEGEHELLPVRSYRAPSETDIAIAKIVVNEIPDGAVLSLGVGGVPYTVAKMLAESDKKDLGCHTGTISDAFLELYRRAARPHGSGERREHRHAPALRRRRPDGLPRGGVPLQGRQGLHLHQLFPCDKGRRAQEQHPCHHPRRQHDFRPAHDDPVCRDRVRDCKPFRQDAARARRGDGLHRAPRLP